MKKSFASAGRQCLHQVARVGLRVAPRGMRFGLIRRLVQCDPAPDPRLVLKIAETRDELEACFAILHDAYVAQGYMRPDPSGLRVTPYHALPTTTTLCAKFDGEVVGTLSIVREGVFGFPLQSAFDLRAVRARGGQIAEISALAVHRDFRQTGGRILFPLMKFMFEYCTRYFDTRHLVIAVNPDRIELYEALLMFQRLQASVVARYDFANGAPAIGATLDLAQAPAHYAAVYGRQRDGRNLHHYFTALRLPHIQWPDRPYFTTNHPVLTPELMDWFFNQRTQVFAGLDARRRGLLRSIYDLPAYAAVLPALDSESTAGVHLRQHQRYSVRCPARLHTGSGPDVALDVVRLSDDVFEAECTQPLPQDIGGQVTVQLGDRVRSVVTVSRLASRGAGDWPLGFRIHAPDEAWRRCVSALRAGHTHADLCGAF